MDVIMASCADMSKYEYNLEKASWRDIAMASDLLYTNNQSRIIDCFVNDNHYNGEYWLRSSRDVYHFNFYTVGGTGKAGSAVAESLMVVAPGFCI